MANQPRLSEALQVGDTVAFTQDFLDRHSLHTGTMPFARGKVTALHRVVGGIVLADIEWNKPGLSKRFDVKNLVKVAR
jgi:hypothetical protein